jgi:Exonuclease
MSASVKTRVVESLVDLAVDICIRELGTVMDVFVLICLFLNLALATNTEASSCLRVRLSLMLGAPGLLRHCRRLATPASRSPFYFLGYQRTMAVNSLDFYAGPLVWIDCEMTGLNPRKDKILEIAVRVFLS